MKRIGVVLAGGLVLGVAGRLIDDVAPRWVGNVGAVWFIAAFISGRLSRRVKESVFLGAATLVAAWASYYAMRLFADGTISISYLGRVGVFWLAASLLVGAAGGLVGTASLRLKAAWGIAIGVPLGEALAVTILSQRWEQVTAETLGALALLTWSGRRASDVAPVALTTTVVVAALAGAYRAVLA